jgi:hypothetical protein
MSGNVGDFCPIAAFLFYFDTLRAWSGRRFFANDNEWLYNRRVGPSPSYEELQCFYEVLQSGDNRLAVCGDNRMQGGLWLGLCPSQGESG